MKRHATWLLIGGFVLLAALFGTARLDIDEFGFIKEPYELVGGDYTLGYLRAHEFANALDCAGRSYRFFWHYRPLYSPIIAARDQVLFAAEERRFGYVRPEEAGSKSLDAYRQRLIVPEPDRFYRHGAGEGLLSPVLRMPALALTRLLSRPGRDLLDLQFHRDYHWLFLIPRLQGLLAGVLCLLLVRWALVSAGRPDVAVLGMAWMAVLPPTLSCFPNIHYDAILAPLVLLSSVLFVRGRHGWAGVAFGLALAAKNTAVFMLPAAIAFVAWEAMEAYRSGGAVAARATLSRRGMGTAWFAVTALAALTPFADPVSMIQEILIPVFPRPYDMRGEDVASFGVMAQFTARGATAAGLAAPNPAVLLFRVITGFDVKLLLLLIGLPLVWSRISLPISRFSFFFLLMVFPYSVIFGGMLEYRSLMFLPFCALIAAEVLGRRALLATIAAFLVVDLIFAFDPISSAGLPYAAVRHGTSILAPGP
jgi:hypothetical protein